MLPRGDEPAAAAAATMRPFGSLSRTTAVLSFEFRYRAKNARPACESNRRESTAARKIHASTSPFFPFFLLSSFFFFPSLPPPFLPRFSRLPLLRASLFPTKSRMRFPLYRAPPVQPLAHCSAISMARARIADETIENDCLRLRFFERFC